MTDEDILTRAVVAATIVGAKRDIPSDVLGLLINGDANRGIPPNALRLMIAAAIRNIHEQLRDR